MWNTPSETGPFLDPANWPAPSVTATVIAPHLEPHIVALLAREIAIEINEVETILGHFQLTGAQLERIRELPFFQKIYAAEYAAWKSASNTVERMKLEAAATLEMAMPAVGARMLKDTEPLEKVVAAGQMFMKIAGIGGENQKGFVPGEKYSIVINIGDAKLEKTIEPIMIEQKPAA